MLNRRATFYTEDGENLRRVLAQDCLLRVSDNDHLYSSNTSVCLEGSGVNLRVHIRSERRSLDKELRDILSYHHAKVLFGDKGLTKGFSKMMGRKIM